MCLEDLRLGKGRFPQPSVSRLQTGVTALVLSADPRRVAILVSFLGDPGNVPAIGAQLPDSAQLFFGTSNIQSPGMVITVLSSPIVLRIEDLGILITGEIYATVSDLNVLGSQLYLQPIVSDVNVPPMILYPDVKG